jgi:hypothetical protein
MEKSLLPADNRQFAADIPGIESDIIRMLAEVTASAVS